MLQSHWTGLCGPSSSPVTGMYVLCPDLPINGTAISTETPRKVQGQRSVVIEQQPAFGEHTSLCTHVWDAASCVEVCTLFILSCCSFDKDFVLYIKSTLFFSMTGY